uniref:Uncharacterized protein n=1 Tax=Arundo donax TaxID=35708 RepID=A0A0A9EM02_ARUDO
MTRNKGSGTQPLLNGCFMKTPALCKYFPLMLCKTCMNNLLSSDKLWLANCTLYSLAPYQGKMARRRLDVQQLQ